MDQGTRGGEEEWNELGDWGGHVFTSRCKEDNSGDPAVERRELSPVLCDDLEGWEGIHVYTGLIHVLYGGNNYSDTSH